MIYVFDLDGTLCRTRGENYFEAMPNHEAIRRVRELREAGHRIVVDSARGSGNGRDYTAMTRKQLQLWGVPYHELRCGVKIPGDVYVDDRAINARDWMKRMANG